MDHFSNSAALSAAAAASAVSGSPPGSGASYSNQAAVQAAIGSSLQQTTTVSSPSSYSVNHSSGNLGNSSNVGQQQSSSSPTTNISHNNTSAALLASQVSRSQTRYTCHLKDVFNKFMYRCNVHFLLIHSRFYLLITTRLYHHYPRLELHIIYMANTTKVIITSTTLKVTKATKLLLLTTNIIMRVR